MATAADDIGDGDADDIINIIYLWTEMMLGLERKTCADSVKSDSQYFFNAWDGCGECFNKPCKLVKSRLRTRDYYPRRMWPGSLVLVTG